MIEEFMREWDSEDNPLNSLFELVIDIKVIVYKTNFFERKK